MSKNTALERLKTINFKPVGNWELSKSKGLALRLSSKVSDKKGAVYAFSVNGEVKYIGVTEKGLTKRIRHYVRPGPSQRTNQRIRQHILETLKHGFSVEIYAWHDLLGYRVGGFEVIVALGLEPTLIKTFNPAWNKKGANN
jgi:hypothetical protein